jgi:DNA-binding transcriptional LysR family regulator
MADDLYQLRIDWDDLRLFLEIARGGTLTAAAARLHLTQPTAGRRLRSLEQVVGAALFQRSAEGFRLTDEGEAMLRHAEQMEEEYVALERKLLGGARGLEGTLKLSCSDWFASRVLAAPLSGFARANPGITVELISDARLFDLRRREADVVFRFIAFSDVDIVQRRFTHITYGLYASPSYLSEHGDPGSGEGAGHSLVTMDSAFARLPDAEWLRTRWPGARIAFRSNNREAQAAACASGAGLAVLPRVVGDGLDLELLEGNPPGRDIWLGYHEDMKRLRRLRMLVDHLAAHVPSEI